MQRINFDRMILRIQDDEHILADRDEIGVRNRDFASIRQPDDERTKIRV